MATGLYINTKQLTKGAKAFNDAATKFPRQIGAVLTANALDIERKAKRAAPADRGQIRQGISADNSQTLKKVITSQAPYSAYIEFGTGKQAAKYVATLPATYKAYAAQFKGKGGGGTFKQFVKLIYEWMKRKGIKGGTYSVKTRRRLGNATEKRIEDLALAYFLALSILKKGVHPHPFLIPALISQEKILKRELLEAIVTLMKLR
jgi:hypothetical protein